MQETDNPFSEAFGKAVDLGNRIADTDDKADIWDIADGLLAGAVQYWLYSRQPCADPECEECVPISTAEGRIEELRRLIGKVERAGYTLIPLNLHYKGGWIKLEIGLAKGKKQYDKRQDIKERDWQRQQQRLMRQKTTQKA